MPTKSSGGQSLAGVLTKGLGGLAGEDSTIIWNVNDRYIVGDRNVALGQMRDVLSQSGRVFLYDRNVVYESRSQKDGNLLLPIMLGDRLCSTAAAHLSNLLHCGMAGEDSPVTYQVPAKVISELLNSEVTREQLPRVAYYSRRPVFNPNFELRGPGYWAEDGLLVHGKAIMPVPWLPLSAERAVDRLPPGLKGLLKDFCFQADADLVNALAVLLTGILPNHFITGGKPIVIHNGNQRGVGKTLLAAAYGLLLDGEQPQPLQHSDDEDEMAKRLGARIKPGMPFSVLLFDNRKGTIGGSLLESLALAPRVSVRLLGHNEEIGRSNNFVWAFTANNAQATPDVTDRAIIIRLRFEGDPKGRFAQTGQTEDALKDYVHQHRHQILAELLGMVVRWREAGQPLLPPRHRLQRWSALIGGILQVAGFPEFLTNQEEATLEIDEDLQGLAMLAEHILGKSRQGFFTAEPVDEHSFGKLAKEWLPAFREAGLLQKELHEGAGERMQATAIGKFFGSRLNKPVPVQVGDRAGRATLKVQPGRSRQRRYWFAVTWDDAATAESPASASASPPLHEVPHTPAPVGEVIAPPDTSDAVPKLTPPSQEEVAQPPDAVGGSGNGLDWEE